MSVFEIIFFVITALMGFSIVYSTLTLGISPMPSSMKARQAMLQLSDELDHEVGMETGIAKRTGPILELGSGWGGLLISMAKKYPQREIVGFELSIMPWFTTLILIKALGLKNIKVCRQNFIKADIAGASVIFCYLFPAGMTALDDKLTGEDAWPEYLISNNFSLPSGKPMKVIELDDLYKSPVYLYKFKD